MSHRLLTSASILRGRLSLGWRAPGLNRRILTYCVAAAAITAIVVPPNLARAQSSNATWISEGESVRHVVVTINKSRTFVISRSFSSAVVGSPEIADAIPMTDRTLYIQGKKVGTTNVTVFDESMRLIGVLDVEVAIDTGNLQHKISSSARQPACPRVQQQRTSDLKRRGR